MPSCSCTSYVQNWPLQSDIGQGDGDGEEGEVLHEVDSVKPGSAQRVGFFISGQVGLDIEKNTRFGSDWVGVLKYNVAGLVRVPIGH